MRTVIFFMMVVASMNVFAQTKKGSNNTKSSSIVIEGIATDGNVEGVEVPGGIDYRATLTIKDQNNKVVKLPPIVNYEKIEINSFKLFEEGGQKSTGELIFLLNKNLKNKKITITYKTVKKGSSYDNADVLVNSIEILKAELVK